MILGNEELEKVNGGCINNIREEIEFFFYIIWEYFMYRERDRKNLKIN